MNEYRIKKERERILKSSVLVLGTTTIIFLALWIIGLLEFEDFNNYSGPVKITFGVEDGAEDVVVPVKEIVKEDQPEVDPEPEVEPLPEEVITPESTPEPEEAPKEKIKEVPKPEEPVKETIKEPKEEKPPQPVIQKGVESGNSHETTFQSDSSKIGRRAYIPISLYMPLPKAVSRSLFSSITGDITGFGEEGYNRKAFLKFYRDNGSDYVLDETTPLDSRPEIWSILKEAGYNLDKAEYKTGRKLKSVIISFEIRGNTNGSNAIKSANLESSSGYEDIDEAVLYGFKKSTYSNSTDDDVKGRFRYSFN